MSRFYVKAEDCKSLGHIRNSILEEQRLKFYGSKAEIKRDIFQPHCTGIYLNGAAVGSTMGRGWELIMVCGLIGSISMDD